MKLAFLVCFWSIACLSQNNIINYLPKNYVRDASIDYTSYLQKALDGNSNVLMPDFPILINHHGLNLKSNQKVTFQKNSILILKANSETHYAMLNLKNVTKVTVVNPKLIGDKLTHKDDEGEWGMGINIISSSDIDIINPQISKTWGDGIYIGEIKVAEKKSIVKDSYSNNNIKITNGLIDNCLRNGISIISGINVIIDGTTIQNIDTKAPRAAIDIEPNHAGNVIKDIQIKNITTKNNFNGIVVMLTKIITGKNINIGTILVYNHKDYNSVSALTISNYSKKLKNPEKLKPLIGEILIRDNNYFGTSKIYMHYKTSQFNPQIKFFNVNYYKKQGNKFMINNDFNTQLKESLKADMKVKYIVK